LVDEMGLGKGVTLFIVLLIFPSISMVLGENIFTVGTDKQVYSPGENVIVSGVADADVEVFIYVFDGAKTLFNLSVTAKQDTAQQEMASDQTSRYLAVISLPEDALLGSYTVTAVVGEETIKTMFTVTDRRGEVQIATGSGSTMSEDIAEKMLERTKGMREKINKALEGLKEDNVEIPDEAFQNLNLGVEKEREAQEHFNAGNMTIAAQRALNALRLYGDAYKIIALLLPDATISDTIYLISGEISTQGLRLTIDRAFNYLDGVEKTADRLEEEGYTIDTEIRNRLMEATDSLITLKEELDSGKVTIEAAAEECARIRALLGQTMGLLQRTTIKDHKKAMAERFLDSTQSRIQGLNDKINILAREMGNGLGTGVNITLGNVLIDMNGIKERLRSGDVDDAIGDLDSAVNEIDDDLNNLDGGSLSFNFTAINSIEAKIWVLRATAERLNRKGLNTTTIGSELGEAEKLLEQVMALLVEGDIEAAEELLRAAETHSQVAASEILSSGRRNNSDITSSPSGTNRISDAD
jgi:hypothetical protein